SLLHSLWYSYLQASEPNQGLPHFFSKAYLDDQLIARYDSHTGKVEPLVSWMEKMEKEDPNQGKEGNEMLLTTEQVFRDELRSIWQNDSPSHSLRYYYLHLPEPSQGLPQFLIRGYLDDQPITCFDSLTRRGKPLVPWMKEGENENFLALEWVFSADLKKLSQFNHLTEAILGCELREDGSKGGFLHYGYDGWDFISFDKETLRWVTAQPQAQKVKEKWEDDPGWSQRNKIYLEKTCIEQLKSYLSYSKEALQRIEPPVGRVMHKTASEKVDVLICQAFGFYPEEIQAIWRRGEEDCKYETLHRNVAPNSDGTYYVWLSIEIDPKERDLFSCHIKHDSLQEPLVLAWKEDSEEKRQDCGR
ncbi:Major histocompatibility complex class I-related protein, partial [Ophiophagus hannah]